MTKPKIEDGGSAFPIIDTLGPLPNQPGMTLRDYFAAAALPTIYNNNHSNESIAEECYAIADALLKSRNQVKGE